MDESAKNGVQPEVVAPAGTDVQDPKPAAAQETPAATSGEKAKAKQSPEENRKFKEMRQERERLEQEKAEKERRIDELVGENQRLKDHAQLYADTVGISAGDPAEVFYAAISEKTGKSIAEIRAEEQNRSSRLKSAVENAPEFRKLKEERDRLARERVERIFSSDVTEIKKHFPGETAETIDDLGMDFKKLRAAGVDTLTAYRALHPDAKETKPAATEETPAPEPGKPQSPASPEKEFYTPEEVDRLTPKELDDPTIFEKVKKSMTKWKKSKG